MLIFPVYHNDLPGFGYLAGLILIGCVTVPGERYSVPGYVDD
jgi:hypothetical protein